MMLGLTEPTRGAGSRGRDGPGPRVLAVKRTVGYMPDDVGFYDDLTGRRTCATPHGLNRLQRNEIERCSISCSARSACSTPPTDWFAATAAACASVSVSPTRW